MPTKCRFVAACRRAIVLMLVVLPLACKATMVRLQSSVGLIDIQLYDNAAPLTVSNFLAYVNSGAYNNSLIHRSVPGFVIQGGGFAWPATRNTPVEITTMPAVKNEFSPDRSNTRGTVSMAKLGGNPNSATSQWFINLANNSGNLDAQNGGFTVFGKVSEASMKTADAIAALTVVYAGANFESLPVTSIPATGILNQANVVLIYSATVLPSETESDRVFNYLEATYPEFLAPMASSSGVSGGYYYRYYKRSDSYIGTANGKLYYLVPQLSFEIGELGTMKGWLGTATRDGY